MKRHALLALAFLPAYACDPQEGPQYEGEPVAQLRGSVVAGEGAPDEAQAAILWYTSTLADCQGPTLECGFGAGGDDSTDFECLQACGDPACNPDAIAEWEACAISCGVLEVSSTIDFEGCATGGLGESVALSVDSFPGEFELALYDAPPAETLLRGQDDGPRVAMGILTALSPDAPATFDFLGEGEEFDSILGGVTTHFLIYAADPIPAESAWGQYLGGSFDTGYHLVRYDADVDCEEFDDGCVVSNERRTPEPAGFDVDLEMRFAPLGEIVLPF